MPVTSLRTPGSHLRPRSASPSGRENVASRLLHDQEGDSPIPDKPDKTKTHPRTLDGAIVKVERIEVAPKKIAPSCVSGGISGMNSINLSTNSNSEFARSDVGSRNHGEHARKLAPSGPKPICIKSEPHPLSVQKPAAGWKPIGPATETTVPRRLSETIIKQERHEDKQEKLDKKPVLPLPVSSAPVSMVTTTTTTMAAAVTTSVTSLTKNLAVATTGGHTSQPQTTVSEQIAAIKKFEKDRLKPCKGNDYALDIFDYNIMKPIDVWGYECSAFVFWNT